MRDFAHLSDRPAAQQNPQFGKRLDREIYVASEASATPPRSYAPVDRHVSFLQGRFKQLFALDARFLALDSGV
jgi:hypothetical protein